MTTRDPSEELIRSMLERRADAPLPGWLLADVAGAVRTTGQAAHERRIGWLPGDRRNRLLLVAAAALLLLSMTAGALLASGVLRLVQAPRLPAAIIATPSPSPEASLEPVPTPSGVAIQPPPKPAESPAPAVPVVSRTWSLPAGWRYEIDCGESSPPCLLHLYDQDAKDQPGWPVTIRGDCYDVAVGPAESAFVDCTRNGQAVLTGYDRTGLALPGWPVKVRGSVESGLWNDFESGGGAPSIAVGPEGTVYVTVLGGGRNAGVAIHAFARDGTPRKGWPHGLDGEAPGFALAPDGTVVAWGYEGIRQEIYYQARRTVFTMIGSDGSTLPGWPIGSKGAASGPVIRDDGGISYVSATGKVWTHDRTGSIVSGWPFQLPFSIPPRLGDDGTLLFIGDDRVIALDRRGKPLDGWPYRTRGTLSPPGCDTGGSSEPLFLLSADGTLYLAPFDGTNVSIVALNRHGRAVEGWPYKVPAGWRVFSLAQAPDGTLTAGLIGDSCSWIDPTSIALTTAGTIVGDPPRTSLAVVYDSLRVEGLRVTTGSTVLQEGEGLGYDFDLVNRSRSPLALPIMSSGERPWYGAGTIQTWVERLEPGPPLDCLDLLDPDDETSYATGGWTVVSESAITIPPGGSFPGTETTLYPEYSACLQPGRYRLHVGYESLDGWGSGIKSEQSMDITILPKAEPVPTAIPSPIATPPPTSVPNPPKPSPSPTP